MICLHVLVEMPRGPAMCIYVLPLTRPVSFHRTPYIMRVIRNVETEIHVFTQSVPDSLVCEPTGCVQTSRFCPLPVCALPRAQKLSTHAQYRQQRLRCIVTSESSIGRYIHFYGVTRPGGVRRLRI